MHSNSALNLELQQPVSCMLSLDDLVRRYVLCGCMHVRTGVFLLGVAHVLYHVVILTLFPLWTTYLRRSKRSAQTNYLSPMTFLQWEQFTVDLFSPQTFVAEYTFSSVLPNGSNPSFIYGKSC